MPSINIDVAYFTHKKTGRLVGLLGRGAEVVPIRLWCHCGEHYCEDGILAGYSEQEIEAAADWWGKPGVMVPALEKTGFLERADSGWRIKNWLEHQGHIAAHKARGRMMAAARWKKARDAISNAASMLQAMPKPTSTGTHTPGASAGVDEDWHRPTFEEVTTFAKMGAGLPDEAVMKWFFECDGRPIAQNGAYTDRNGHPIRKWKSNLNAYCVGWRGTVQKEKQQHGSNRNYSKPGTDRNAGTYNEGKGSQYRDVGKVGPVGGVSGNGQP